MVRRVDRIKDIQGQALRMRRNLGVAARDLCSQGSLHRWSCRGGIASQDVQDVVGPAAGTGPPLAGPAANWLFIKGGMVVLLMLGLMVLGLIGIFR